MSSAVQNSAESRDDSSCWDQFLSNQNQAPESALKQETNQIANDENNIKQEPHRIYCFSPVRSKPIENSFRPVQTKSGLPLSPKLHHENKTKAAAARRITQSPAILMPTPSTKSYCMNQQRPSRGPLSDLNGLVDSNRQRADSQFLFSPSMDFSSRNVLSPGIDPYSSSHRYHSNTASGGMGLAYRIGAQILNRSSVPLSPATQHNAMKLLANHSSAWNERFNELLEYKKIHGDCLVPQRYPQNPQLGVWVNKQRAEYKLFKEGKKSSMTKERIQALEAVGFIWAKRRKGQPTWDLKFDELTDYRQEHGDCLVPTKYAENPALGRWVSTQRAQYKLMQEDKPTTMTEERVKMLENLGFVWRLQF